MKLEKVEINEAGDASITLKDDESATAVVIHFNKNDIAVWSNRSIETVERKASNKAEFKIDRRNGGSEKPNSCQQAPLS